MWAIQKKKKKPVKTTNREWTWCVGSLCDKYIVCLQSLTFADMSDSWGFCGSGRLKTFRTQKGGRSADGQKTTLWWCCCSSAAHRSAVTLWSLRSHPKSLTLMAQQASLTAGEITWANMFRPCLLEFYSLFFRLLLDPEKKQTCGCLLEDGRDTDHGSQGVQSWIQDIGQLCQEHLPQHFGVAAVSR